MFGTIWSLLPPLVAIVLAVITKELYGSLFIGIILGGLFATSFSPLAAFETTINDGFFTVLSDTHNIGLFLFLILMGVLFELMKRSGATKAYGDWALKRIKTKKGALAATFGLGLLFSMDDSFHSLAVGGTMLPVNDGAGVSRAKLAYQIDATAAPLCILIPVSTWAAAVCGAFEDGNGMAYFVQSIPFNFYSLLTVFMVIFLIITGLDFGPMKKCENEAASVMKEKAESTEETTEFVGNPTALAEESTEFAGTPTALAEESTAVPGKRRGRAGALDLILPVIILAFSCLAFTLYTGNFFRGVDLLTAVGNCSVQYSLSAGAMITVIFTIIYYPVRGLLPYGRALESMAAGFKTMVPPLLILVLALTLKKMSGLIGSDEYIRVLVSGTASGIGFMLPAIIFILSAVIAFATGSSWGTFCILIPVVAGLSAAADERMLVITISACLAGSVCGDHCSPVSNTTILSAAGAGCDHMKHFLTQLPYALPAAAVSFAAYIVAGLTESVLSLGLALLLMFATLFIINRICKNKKPAD